MKDGKQEVSTAALRAEAGEATSLCDCPDSPTLSLPYCQAEVGLRPANCRSDHVRRIVRDDQQAAPDAGKTAPGNAPLRFQYDAPNDLLTVEGTTFKGDFFRFFDRGREGQLFRLTRFYNDGVQIEKVDPGSLATFADGKKIYDQGWNDGLDKFIKTFTCLVEGKFGR